MTWVHISIRMTKDGTLTSDHISGVKNAFGMSMQPKENTFPIFLSSRTIHGAQETLFDLVFSP
jgi:hypothetical protein